MFYHRLQWKASHISLLQSEFLKVTLSRLLCSKRLTWRKNVWLDKSYRSHPPLLILPKSSLGMLCVCASEKGHGQAWIRENTLKLSGSQAVGCCRLCQRQEDRMSSLEAAWDLWLAERWGWSGAEPKYIYENTYTNTYEKEIAALLPLLISHPEQLPMPSAKKTVYSLTHICLWLQWMPDQGPEAALPTACAFSHVPISPFERRALMCLHNAAITSTIPRQINQRQHNSQIQRIPKLRSGSITLRQTPRERETHTYIPEGKF